MINNSLKKAVCEDDTSSKEGVYIDNLLSSNESFAPPLKSSNSQEKFKSFIKIHITSSGEEIAMLNINNYEIEKNDLSVDEIGNSII